VGVGAPRGYQPTPAAGAPALGIVGEADQWHGGLAHRQQRDAVTLRLLGEAVAQEPANSLDARDRVGPREDVQGGQRGGEGAAREEERAGEVDALGRGRSASRARPAERAWPLAMAFE